MLAGNRIFAGALGLNYGQRLAAVIVKDIVCESDILPRHPVNLDFGADLARKRDIILAHKLPSCISQHQINEKSACLELGVVGDNRSRRLAPDGFRRDTFDE